jgi:hypothetical protein
MHAFLPGCIAKSLQLSNNIVEESPISIKEWYGANVPKYMKG